MSSITEGISSTGVSFDAYASKQDSERLENAKQNIKFLLDYPRTRSSDPDILEATSVMKNTIPLIAMYIDPNNDQYTISALNNLILCPRYGILTSVHPAWSTNQNTGHARSILDRIRIAMFILNLQTDQWVNRNLRGKPKFSSEKTNSCVRGGLIKMLQGKDNYIPYLARPKSVGNVIYILYDILKNITDPEIQHFLSYGSIKKKSVDWITLKALAHRVKKYDEAPSSVTVSVGELPEPDLIGKWTVNDTNQREVHGSNAKMKFASIVWRSLIASRVCRSEHKNDYMRLRMVTLTKKGMIMPPAWINRNWISDFEQPYRQGFVY